MEPQATCLSFDLQLLPVFAKATEQFSSYYRLQTGGAKNRTSSYPCIRLPTAVVHHQYTSNTVYWWWQLTIIYITASNKIHTLISPHALHSILISPSTHCFMRHTDCTDLHQSLTAEFIVHYACVQDALYEIIYYNTLFKFQDLVSSFRICKLSVCGLLIGESLHINNIRVARCYLLLEIWNLI